MKPKQKLISLILTWPIIILSCSMQPEVESDATQQRYTEQYRPQFHFSPDSMWMNDPNGMVYYEGEYHLFYQFHPYSTVWGPMHWGHAVSTDLMHWEHLPIALYPDSLGTIFSGSAVVDWNNTSGLGTTENPPMVAIFTHHNQKLAEAGSTQFQYQSIAYSLDKGRSWTKYAGNPVLPNPGIRDFRDPKVSWYEEEQKWIMVFAAYDRILFYSSPDLIRWTMESEFTAERAPDEGVWECPDFFPLNYEGQEHWVLIVSIGGGGPNGGSGTKYYLGDFDGLRFTCSEAGCKARWLDFGKDNYAGVTWSDIPKEDGRRIFLGWMSNWQYANQVPTERWRSAMTLPRELSLEPDGKGYVLKSSLLKELDGIKTEAIELDPERISAKRILDLGDLEASQYDIRFTFKIDPGSDSDRISNFGLLLENKSGQELTAGIDLKNSEVYIDRSKSGKVDFSEHFPGKHTAPYAFLESGQIELRALVDKSSIELFLDDGKVVMTELFFPDESFNTLSVYSSGGSVELLEGKISGLKNCW